MRLISLGTGMAVVAVAMTACSGGSGQDKKGPSLVAVKVNGDELSVPQVNAQLARLPNVPPEQQQQTRKQVVTQLVDQQLLVQQAKDKKLDRDPEVLAALESARAQVLSQAYLQKTLFNKAQPNDVEIGKYYGDNPALFSQRRVYRLQELATDLPLARLNDLKQVTSKAKTLAEVDQWLKANGAKTASNAAVRPAEALPLTQLPTIGAMKDGQVDVIVNGTRITVLQVLQSQSQPLNEQQAKPLISQFLGSQKREQLASDDIARLRKEAKIEYVGEFNALMTAAAASAPDAPVVAQGASAPATASNAGSIEKGLSGLR